MRKRSAVLVSAASGLAVLLFSLLPVACSSEPPKACTPGQSEACAGAGGCAGFQVCNASGSGFDPCMCAASDAGQDAGHDAGAQPDDAGTDDAGTDDAGTDAGGADAGTCDPLAAPGQQGCGAGQKCTWIVVQDQPSRIGTLGCVPDGTVAQGGTCAQGPAGLTTGYDDCAAGGICIGTTCQDICELGATGETGCGASATCTRYSGLFANDFEDPLVGACTPSCNPVTQQVGDGGTCGTGKGCYLLVSSTTTQAVCAGAGTVQHNQVISGTAYANSCVPAHQPRPIYGTSQVECGALCAPADVTETTHTTEETGVAPYTCELQSAASPTPAAPPSDPDGESCRYWWGREPFSPASVYGNTVGWCFKHSVFQYDSDGNGTKDSPFPRCINLTTNDVVPPVMNPPGNDALEFFCIASLDQQPLWGAVRRAPLQEPALDRLTGWRR